MNTPRKRPTQMDVARLAGVSRATVSFVLNDTSGGIPIGEETRRKVLEAAEALNYTPDPIARMLVSGSSNLIGVFTYEESFPLERSDFYYEFILGIERAAARYNQNVVLFTRQGEAGQPRQVYASGANTLRLASGTIFLGVNPNRAELARLVQEDYPFVYIGRREVPGCEIDWVAADYVLDCAAAVRRLLQLNHRHLAYVVLDRGSEPDQDKLRGIRQALLEVEGAHFHVLAEEVLGSQPRFMQALRQCGATAIICSYSVTFDLTLDYLQQAGLSVPGDYSVIGLGDVNPVRCFACTPTFVSSNRQHWGEVAVETLMRRINGEADTPQQILIPCQLIEGDSAVYCENPFGRATGAGFTEDSELTSEMLVK